MKNEVIKFKDVKTIEQVTIISSRIYERGEYLKSVMYDNSEEGKKRVKATLLWLVVSKMLTQLALYFIQYSHSQSTEFESGGIVLGEAHQNEVILNEKYFNNNLNKTK